MGYAVTRDMKIIRFRDREPGEHTFVVSKSYPLPSVDCLRGYPQKNHKPLVHLPSTGAPSEHEHCEVVDVPGPALSGEEGPGPNLRPHSHIQRWLPLRRLPSSEP